MSEKMLVSQGGPAKSFRPRARPADVASSVVGTEQSGSAQENGALDLSVQHQLQEQYGIHAVEAALSGADTDPFSTVIVAEWALGMAELPGLLGSSNEALAAVQSTLSSPEFAMECDGILSRHAQGEGGPVHVERALALIRQSRGQALPVEVAARLSQAIAVVVAARAWPPLGGA